MVLLKMVMGSLVEDMSWWCRSVVVDRIGGSGWRLCVSFVLFYLVRWALVDSSDDKFESVWEHVRGPLIPMCCLHLGILSI
jgi:hypothetical protein